MQMMLTWLESKELGETLPQVLRRTGGNVRIDFSRLYYALSEYQGGKGPTTKLWHGRYRGTARSIMKS